MDKKYYIYDIEKTASIKTNILKSVKKNSGLIKKVGLGAGIGGTALGTTYALSSDKNKERMRNGAKFVGRSIVDSELNGKGEQLLSNIGGAIGTGIALKRGKSLGQAISGGGIAGLAAGNIIGASTIPTYQLYKKHKKEFGTNPDAKSVAAVVGANTLPVAALWGGLYGMKKGVATRQKISKNLEQSLGRAGASAKIMKRDFNGLIDQASKIKPEHAKHFDDYMKKTIKDDITSVRRRAFKVGKSLLPMQGLEFAAAVPSYFGTPNNIIKYKKYKQEKQNKNENE